MMIYIHGQDLVLGVQWLQQLGKVTQDYANLTLAFTWDGKQRVGTVAYHLELPAGSRIHPLFHVSLLRPFHGNPTKANPLPLPAELVEGRAPSRPVRVHGYRTTLMDGLPVRQALVEWTDGGLADASWEPVETLGRKYPDFHLEDKKLDMWQFKYSDFITRNVTRVLFYDKIASSESPILSPLYALISSSA
ncbi:unnamed protein product [Cuscuta campestris]|uniref:Tf2-1-like SH3-like domain-containing protein n=1 Tax=Cuscuta campestris TaxID=132261 RepID=A0A484K4Z9_9ASTE|nr:unnamed protein product [Cuscuta campestris]